MSLGLTIINYNEHGEPYHLENFVSELSYRCSLDKPCQEITMKITFAIFSQAFPAHYIDTGSRMEVYRGDKAVFKGRVITSNMTSSETLELTCFDYVWWLMRSKVCYNFQNMSAKMCIKQILDDLEIGYSDNGILTGESNDITINRLIKNKTAYQAIMQICTELHKANQNYYYVFMDVSGNVGVRTCDVYWAKQTLKACSNTSLSNPDGNIISFSYGRDMSEMITRVLAYDSTGTKASLDGSSSGDNTNTNPDWSEGDE